MSTDWTEFDAQRAKAWKAEVDAEFADVKVLLKQVTEECTKDPIGDDTILKAVDSAGQYLNEKWTELGDAYDKIQEKLGKSFNEFEKAIDKGVEIVEEMKKKIRL